VLFDPFSAVSPHKKLARDNTVRCQPATRPGWVEESRFLQPPRNHSIVVESVFFFFFAVRSKPQLAYRKPRSS